MKSRLPFDGGLSVRMGLTMFLLVIVYAVFIGAMVHFGVGLVFIAFVAAIMLFVQYYYSDKIVLMSTGARLTQPAEAPELHNMVARLASEAGLPTPRVAIMDTNMPNAFATGRNSQHAVITVTTGLLRRLEPGEVEAVLGHEMSHIRHGDVTIMTMASVLSAAAAMIVQFSFYGFGDERGGNNDNPLVMDLIAGAVWLVSWFLIQALSRYREYAADRGSALLTGKPSELAAALIKLNQQSAVPKQDLRRAQAFNALMIVPALAGGNALMELFSTHPTLEHRLAQLKKLGGGLSR